MVTIPDTNGCVDWPIESEKLDENPFGHSRQLSVTFFGVERMAKDWVICMCLSTIKCHSNRTEQVWRDCCANLRWGMFSFSPLCSTFAREKSQLIRGCRTDVHHGHPIRASRHCFRGENILFFLFSASSFSSPSSSSSSTSADIRTYIIPRYICTSLSLSKDRCLPRRKRLCLQIRQPRWIVQMARWLHQVPRHPARVLSLLAPSIALKSHPSHSITPITIDGKSSNSSSWGMSRNVAIPSSKSMVTPVACPETSLSAWCMSALCSSFSSGERWRW